MSINWKAVARDVTIVFGLVFASSYLAVQLVTVMGDDVTADVIGYSNIFWGTVGFTISGSLARTNRWKHLFVVALGLWLVSFVNVVVGMTPIQVWAVGLLLILVMMGLGGGLSYLFVRTPKAEAAAPPDREA